MRRAALLRAAARVEKVAQGPAVGAEVVGEGVEALVVPSREGLRVGREDVRERLVQRARLSLELQRHNLPNHAVSVLMNHKIEARPGGYMKYFFTPRWPTGSTSAKVCATPKKSWSFG